MGTPILRRVMLVSVLVTASLLGACTRSASTPPPTTGGEPTASGDSQQATMDAVRQALLTQNATGGDEDATATLAPPTLTEAPTLPPTATHTPEPSPTFRPFTTQTQEYTVQAGDTVNSIAIRFGVDPDQLIALNNLQSPYTLALGQVLTIPSGTGTASGPTATPITSGSEYTVLPGEWIWSIARKLGVDPYAIIDANNLQYPYTLYPGDVLVIP